MTYLFRTYIYIYILPMKRAHPTKTTHLENRWRLKYFCHERRHALELTVTGTNTCWDGIDNSYLDIPAWNKATELCHQRHHSNLQTNCYHYYRLDAPTLHQHLRSRYGALNVELSICEDLTAILDTLCTAIRDVLTWYLRGLDVDLRYIMHCN